MQSVGKEVSHADYAAAGSAASGTGARASAGRVIGWSFRAGVDEANSYGNEKKMSFGSNC